MLNSVWPDLPLTDITHNNYCNDTYEFSSNRIYFAMLRMMTQWNVQV